MNFSAQEMDIIKDLGRTSLERLAKDEPVESILADLYCQLPEKTEDIGRAMGARVIDLVDQYERSKERALGDKEGWIRECIDEIKADKTQEERCASLYQMLVGFMALNDSAHAQQIIDSAKPFDPSAVSDELEAALEKNLLDVISNSRLGFNQLNALQAHLRESGELDAAAVVDFGKNDRDVKAILTMIAYVGSKSGRLESIPSDATLEMIAPAVCFSMDAQQTAVLLEQGEITAEEANAFIQIIGIVAGTLITIAIHSALDVLSVAILSLMPTILTIPLLPILFLAMNALTDIINSVAVDVCTEILNTGWKVVKGLGRLLLAGVGEALDFAAEHVLPAVDTVFTAAVNWLDMLWKHFTTPAYVETERVRD